jgi:spoIIIJ-associated protein
VSTAEGTGRTIEEAIEHALRELGASREDVRVEILQAPKPALLGFGGRDAKVRVSLRPTMPQIAGTFVRTALGLMGYEVSTRVTDSDEGVTITFEGEGVPALVGRHGRALDALEVVLTPYLHRQVGERVAVTVDAAGYRARREKALRDQATEAAARALAEGMPVALNPMEPRDRRTVHLALRDDPRVQTVSEGEGEQRHVVVLPRPDEPQGDDTRTGT